MKQKTTGKETVTVFPYKPAQTMPLLPTWCVHTGISAAGAVLFAALSRKVWNLATIISLVWLALSFFYPILDHLIVLRLLHRIVISRSGIRHQIGKRIAKQIPWPQLKAMGVLTTKDGKSYLYLCGAGRKRILTISQKNKHLWQDYISKGAIARMDHEENGLWKICLAYYLCTMGAEADEPAFLLKPDDEILEAIKSYSPLPALDLNL